MKNKNPPAEPSGAELRIKVRAGDIVIGPGKIRLLRMIDEAGGISGAARAMGMSYRRAWHLLDTLSSAFPDPLVETAVGGAGGGGARLTPLARRLILDYERAVTAAEAEARPFLEWLDDPGATARPDDRETAVNDR